MSDYKPLVGEDEIDPDWRDRYRERHLFFMHELVSFNHYLFYLEKIAGFPWKLFGEINNHFWEFTYLAMLETSLQIAHRVAFDAGPKRLTLPKFAAAIVEHLTHDETKQRYNAELSSFAFETKSEQMADRIKFLRNNRLAHLSRCILSDRTDERPYLESVPVCDLREVGKFLDDYFQIVSLGVGCALVLPDLMDYRQPSDGPRHEPDIIELLDLIAENSSFLNMPEEARPQWPYSKEVILKSEVDIKTFNKWRAKFGLQKIVDDDEIVEGIVQDIVDRFKRIGFAKGPRNRFGYIRETGSAVIISRETGQDTPIPFAKLVLAVEAVRTDADVYSGGPSRLRGFGITHINSPIWAMLQLMTLDELTKPPYPSSSTPRASARRLMKLK